MITVNLLLIILAFVCFILSAIGVIVPRLNFQSLGLALLTLTLLLK